VQHQHTVPTLLLLLPLLTLTLLLFVIAVCQPSVAHHSLEPPLGLAGLHGRALLLLLAVAADAAPAAGQSRE
jgi:hypothetical protein